MGWETRGNSGPYYTRSKRCHGRVVREYIGGGIAGRLVALLDEREREARASLKEAQQRERAHLEELDSQANAFNQAVDAVVDCLLKLSGYHNHKGQWRHSREKDQ